MSQKKSGLAGKLILNSVLLLGGFFVGSGVVAIKDGVTNKSSVVSNDFNIWSQLPKEEKRFSEQINSSMTDAQIMQKPENKKSKLEGIKISGIGEGHPLEKKIDNLERTLEDYVLQEGELENLKVLEKPSLLLTEHGLQYSSKYEFSGKSLYHYIIVFDREESVPLKAREMIYLFEKTMASSIFLSRGSIFSYFQFGNDRHDYRASNPFYEFVKNYSDRSKLKIILPFRQNGADFFKKYFRKDESDYIDYFEKQRRPIKK